MSPEHDSSGSHALPPTFSGSEQAFPVSSTPAVARRGVRRLFLIGASVLALGAVIGGVQLAANLGYDSALVSAQDATVDAEIAQSELEGAVTDLHATSALGERIDAAITDRLVDADTATMLDDALSGRVEALSDAADALEQVLPAPPQKPFWPWELFAAQSELVALETRADARTDHLSETARAVADAEQALTRAGVAVTQTAATASVDFEAEHVDAANTDIVALRTAAGAITAAGEQLDADLVEAYEALEAAAEAMLRSEESAQWARSGPLGEARVAVEAFARGLSPGLLLDFTWSERVNGYGYGDSLGGRATWWYGDPGYATIKLSDSVAREWPDARSKALVAHEVGHAISVKCHHMYDDTDPATIEDWATAWAISMGHTDQANGTWAYGPPPQELIDAAAQCR